MMKDEIDVSGHDMVETLAKERRRRAEVAQVEGLGELAGMLLPLSVALARLAARCDMKDAA